MNYFELMGIKQNFKVNELDLDNRYLKLQDKFHPDKAVKENELTSVSKSIDVNTAYNILKDDYLRALYLLQLKGIDIANEGEQKIKMPIEKLESIWLLRELIENNFDFNKLSEFHQNALEQKSMLVEALAESFENEENHNASILTMELKYINGIILAVKEKIEQCL